MPIEINGCGRPHLAKEAAIRIYKNNLIIFKYKDIKKIGIDFQSFHALKMYDWITPTGKTNRTIEYKLKPESIDTLKNYILSDSTQICSTCKQTKKLSDFPQSNRLKKGVRKICFECKRKYDGERNDRKNKK